eukprot:4223264-Prymnesium_polylepis.1
MPRERYALAAKVPASSPPSTPLYRGATHLAPRARTLRPATNRARPPAAAPPARPTRRPARAPAAHLQLTAFGTRTRRIDG